MNLSKIASVTAGKTKTSGISPFSELEISKTFEKIVDYGTVDDFEYSLRFDYIEANFYFTSPKNGLTPTFKKDKKYKITIEEI